MKEEERIQEFHMNIIEVANACSTLGEKIPEEKLVRKMLRSLPKILDMKVNELVRCLETLESGFNKRSKKKAKSITFKSNTKEKGEEYDLDTEEGLSNTIVLLEDNLTEY